MAKKNVLGRGLDALIDTKSGNENIVEKISGIAEIEIEKIETNPYQPRTIFDEELLIELSKSIKELGIIQPITLRSLENEKYQIISGERRIRAAKIAGLTTIPAYIRNANDQEMLEMALVENIQRENLNAIEVAISYQRLIEECNLTHDNLSQRVGKQRSTITNYIRLLNLPAKIQSGIKEDKISMGHARALLSIKDEDIQIMIYDQILRYDFSVRKVEDTVKELNKNEEKNEEKKIQHNDSNSEYLSLQEKLSKCLDTDVEFKRNFKGNGKIVIPFKNDNDLERIIFLLDKLNT